MFARPTTEQVLLGIVDHLDELIAPELQTDGARNALGMIAQLLRGCATRSAHEIAWMHDEIEAIASATGSAPVAPASFHLDDVCAAYSTASGHLGDAVDAAYAAGDMARAASLRELLKARSAHEMAIVGALDLVGRG
jgi:hypothetical protein